MISIALSYVDKWTHQHITCELLHIQANRLGKLLQVGILERMLVVEDGIRHLPEKLAWTLRNLERDGLVEHSIYHIVPHRVEYAMTPLGETFGELLKVICTWAETHYAEI
jgi:DNA-binding HxlR family transcriptional regulator